MTVCVFGDDILAVPFSALGFARDTINVSSSSAGVCAVSSLPSPLNGTHASELISLTSADDVVLK